jgi:hypothetical protein
MDGRLSRVWRRLELRRRHYRLGSSKLKIDYKGYQLVKPGKREGE